MDTKNLIDLIKLLRRHGVQVYRTPELELQLTEKPSHKPIRASKGDKVDTDQLTDEQLMYWSTRDEL